MEPSTPRRYDAGAGRISRRRSFLDEACRRGLQDGFHHLGTATVANPAGSGRPRGRGDSDERIHRRVNRGRRGRRRVGITGRKEAGRSTSTPDPCYNRRTTKGAVEGAQSLRRNQPYEEVPSMSQGSHLSESTSSPGDPPGMKTCVKCSVLRPRSDFYASKGMTSGLHSWCKPCCSAAAKARYWSNPESRRAANVKWRLENREQISARRKANPETESARQRRHYIKHRYDPSRVRRRRAGDAVRRALACGEISRGPCADCGLEPADIDGVSRIEGHHHRGYSLENVLDVIWLCARCHRLRHGKGS